MLASRGSGWRCWPRPGRTEGRRSAPRSRSRTARCSSARPSSARPPRFRGNSLALGRRLRRLGAVLEPVIAHDGRDPQAIVFEDAATAGALGIPMLLVAAPPHHRLFVTPERQGQDLPFLRQALEALDRDEAVN